jgi:hypothetical protein
LISTSASPFVVLFSIHLASCFVPSKLTIFVRKEFRCFGPRHTSSPATRLFGLLLQTFALTTLSCVSACVALLRPSTLFSFFKPSAPTTLSCVSACVTAFFFKRLHARLHVLTSARPHVCTSVRLHICTSALLRVFCTSARLDFCAYARLHVCTSARLNVCTSARLHIHTSAHLLVRTSVRLRVCISARLHVCTSGHLHVCTSTPITLVRVSW